MTERQADIEKLAELMGWHKKEVEGISWWCDGDSTVCKVVDWNPYEYDACTCWLLGCLWVMGRYPRFSPELRRIVAEAALKACNE